MFSRFDWWFSTGGFSVSLTLISLHVHSDKASVLLTAQRHYQNRGGSGIVFLWCSNTRMFAWIWSNSLKGKKFPVGYISSVPLPRVCICHSGLRYVQKVWEYVYLQLGLWIAAFSLEACSKICLSEIRFELLSDMLWYQKWKLILELKFCLHSLSWHFAFALQMAQTRCKHVNRHQRRWSVNLSVNGTDSATVR